MSEREELQDLIDDTAVRSRHEAAGVANPDGIADAILSGGYRKPRTITTVDELEALPVGSVVIDADEYVGRKERNSTRLPDWAVTLHKSLKDAHALTLPVTVLWEPLP